MASHGPYNFKYMPEDNVPGGGPGTPAEMDEFLRRLMMAKLDYDFLVAEIKRRFPDKPILIVRYGDHQPTATRSYLGEMPGGMNPNVETEIAPLKLMTFYA